MRLWVHKLATFPACGVYFGIRYPGIPCNTRQLWTRPKDDIPIPSDKQEGLDACRTWMGGFNAR